jgi:hypothetical protein
MKNIKEKVIKSPNLSVIKKSHINKWVVLTSNYKRLIAVGDTLSSAVEKAGNKKSGDNIVIKVLPNLGYAPNVIR